MSAGEPRNWLQAGPVAAAYGQSRAPGAAVCIGPTGGGKTTESVRRPFRIARWQHPSPRDGVRKARIAIIAPTYRRLWDQVIPSYFKEIDRSWGKFTGAKGDPADHIVDIMWGEAPLHVEVMFRAVGENDIEDFFRGLEVTAFHFPEMDTHESGDLLSFASNRVGRYPEPNDRPEIGAELAYAGIYGDANAPIIADWFHKRFYLERRPTDQVFIQPGGFDPGAENLQNLRKINPRYYEDMAERLEPWDVERLVHNRPGYSRQGQPVHPHFDVVRMGVRGLKCDDDSLLGIGIDAGSNTLKHAAVFLQRTWTGQVRALAECQPDGQSDIVEFGKEVRRIKDTKFPHVKRCIIFVDPAARGQSAMRRGVTWAQILQEVTGIEVQLAPSQDPAVRRTAVDQTHKRGAGPGEPGFLIDIDECPKLTAALAGGYRFKRVNDKVSLMPEKLDPSHIAEANQYGTLGLEGPGAAAGGFIHGGDPVADSANLASVLPD